VTQAKIETCSFLESVLDSNHYLFSFVRYSFILRTFWDVKHGQLNMWKSHSLLKSVGMPLISVFMVIVPYGVTVHKFAIELHNHLILQY